MTLIALFIAFCVTIALFFKKIKKTLDSKKYIQSVLIISNIIWFYWLIISLESGEAIALYETILFSLPLTVLNIIHLIKN